MAPLLETRELTVAYGRFTAVHGADVVVPAGGIVGIIGPNGAGKTTLFNVVSGEFPPTSGTIELFGRDVTRLPARKRAKLGLTRTFQKSRLFGGLSVEDNLYLAILGVRHGHLRPIRTRKDAELRERARELARVVGLGDRLDVLVGSLSPGAQRPLEVAMAPAGPARRMMLDEPAAGLSRGERVALAELLRALDPAITLILIEHDMDVALGVAERVTMMHEGRVIVEGTPDEIRANTLVHDLYLGRGHAHGSA
jgi:branched-chain amino acid transport system ATP-binding protein